MPRAVAPRVRRNPSPPPPDPHPPFERGRRLAPRLFRWAVVLCVWGLVAAFAGLIYFAWDLPRPEDALGTTRRPSVTMVAADGALLSTSGDLYGETVRLAGTCRPTCPPPSSPSRTGASATIWASTSSAWPGRWWST